MLAKLDRIIDQIGLPMMASRRRPSSARFPDEI
jgi:hypothetical protein